MPNEALTAVTINDANTGALPVEQADSAGVLIAPINWQQLANGAVATSVGTSATLNVADLHELLVGWNITAISGTSPTITFIIDVSPDGGSTWVLLRQTAPLTAAGTGLMTAVGANGYPFGSLIRLRWLVTGTTPSFTFSLWLHGKP